MMYCGKEEAKLHIHDRYCEIYWGQMLRDIDLQYYEFNSLVESLNKENK